MHGTMGGVRVMMGVKQGDSGQRSKPVRLINVLWIIFIIAFIRIVIFMRQTPYVQRKFACDMCSLMSAGFLINLFIHDFLTPTFEVVI